LREEDVRRDGKGLEGRKIRGVGEDWKVDRRRGDRGRSRMRKRWKGEAEERFGRRGRGWRVCGGREGLRGLVRGLVRVQVRVRV